MSEDHWSRVLALTPPPRRVSLRAGPWTLTYENGDLRDICWDGVEVIRRIYAAVRDHNWGTVPGELSEVEEQVEADRFRIRYTSWHRRGQVDFAWRAAIEGSSDGVVSFSFAGEAMTSFQRNRIGLCVLHPAGCAGIRCRAIRLDGTRTELAFPRWVEPAQPVPGFHDLANLAHEIMPDLWAELSFQGERFEMEDQRNWIDASFKIYGTPLSEPYPVAVPAGATIRQRVQLVAVGPRARWPAKAPARAAASPGAIRIVVGTFRQRVPSLGLGAAGHGAGPAADESGPLRALRLHYLRVDVHLGAADWAARLGQGEAEALALGLPLELAVHLPAGDGAAAVDQLARHLRGTGTPVARVLAFQEGARTLGSSGLALVRRHLRCLQAPIGAGTNADFYQLNQCRPPYQEADFVHWSMNPQVHAFDLTSIAETPSAIQAQVRSAREYFPHKPLVVSPVTLKPRFNPVATGQAADEIPGGLPPGVDARQLTPFAAAWTLAVLKRLAEGGVESVTLFETTGWGGVMERAAGSPCPEVFPSLPGQVYPLYHVLAAAGDFAGGEVIATRSSAPFRVEAMTLARDDRVLLMLGNLTAERQTLHLDGVARVLVRQVEEWHAGGGWMFPTAAGRLASGTRVSLPWVGNDAIHLAPFAFVRLEVEL